MSEHDFDLQPRTKTIVAVLMWLVHRDIIVGEVRVRRGHWEAWHPSYGWRRTTDLVDEQAKAAPA